ncbi:14732_t:CDS:2 [Dentiscutata erythropus]|uniref:14732_t:CDS:1 n=1 Tax=Dentiscutata erythropus TaxID=1348616 RepID=A0A9N8VUF7_9GLOM|nr:14732_t:CDS:2 [Dentiscutata erythropus]
MHDAAGSATKNLEEYEKKNEKSHGEGGSGDYYGFHPIVVLWADIKRSKYENEKLLEFIIDLTNCEVTKFFSEQCNRSLPDPIQLI